MWGVGDATVALIGIPFGKHKVTLKPVNGKKSWEGSCAILLVSAFTGTMFLWLYGGYSAAVSVSCALIMAAAGTIVELFSPSEWDTVTVPVTMLAIALIMLTKN